MAADKTPLKSIELYEVIRKFPEYRVVGDTGDSETCTPFQFSYHKDSLGFFVDLTATQFHKHALCDDIMDLVGDVGEGSLEGDILVKDTENDPWSAASSCYKITRDDSAKWIRLHYR